MESQYRYDLLQKRWVIIASERGKRPIDFLVPAEKTANDGFCPFCPGHEDKTPPEIMSIPLPPGRASNSRWQVRVVPNEEDASRQDLALKVRWPGHQSLPGAGDLELRWPLNG